MRIWVNVHVQTAGLLCFQEVSEEGCDREQDAGLMQQENVLLMYKLLVKNFVESLYTDTRQTNIE